jgi:hypothetical protein
MIKMKRFLFFLVFLVFISAIIYRPSVQAAVNIYGFVGVTGGTSQSLDGIPYAGLNLNDISIGIDANGYFYVYFYDSSSSATPAYPGVIKPTDNPGNGRWLLNPRMYSEGFYSNASDGEHFSDYSNSSSYTGTPTDGIITARRDREMAQQYSGDEAEWVPFQNLKVLNYTVGQSPLPYRAHFGGLVTNDGSTGTNTHTLRSAEKGMYICFAIEEATRNIVFDPQSTDRVLPVCNSDGDKVEMDSNLGTAVCIRSVARDGGYDWQVVSLYPTGATLTDGN